MSHRNHPSRRDLYAYGFREGEAWRDDRRELEAALWEIDQLERQTEYEYQRPTLSYPWNFGRASAWGPPNARYHDAQITRSNSDLYPNSESGMTSLSSQSYADYNDDSTSFDGYHRGYSRRTYPFSHAVPSVFRGYPGSQSSTSSRDHQSPSPLMSSDSNYQNFRDSIGISHRNHFAPSIATSSSYGHSQYSSPPSPAQQISTLGQLQMVTRRGGRNESPSPEQTPAPPSMMSPHWSMVATEGTARSQSPSVTSFQGMYSQNLRDMGYVGGTSGYVESFDSHGEFYGSSDEEYISDDTGYYYSSESEAEEFDEFSEGSEDFYSSE